MPTSPPSCGVTKAALHYHFASKADLGEALIRRYTTPLRGSARDDRRDDRRRTRRRSLPTPRSTSTCCNSNGCACAACWPPSTRRCRRRCAAPSCASSTSTRRGWNGCSTHGGDRHAAIHGSTTRRRACASSARSRARCSWPVCATIRRGSRRRRISCSPSSLSGLADQRGQRLRWRQPLGEGAESEWRQQVAREARPIAVDRNR